MVRYRRSGLGEQSPVKRPKRGEVYLVSFDHAPGSGIGKTRPAVVVQNDYSNRSSPVTIVAAITSRFDEPLYPTEVLIRIRAGGVAEDSVVLLNQIRTIDCRRLVKRLGMLKPATIAAVNRAIQISLGLTDL